MICQSRKRGRFFGRVFSQTLQEIGSHKPKSHHNGLKRVTSSWMATRASKAACAFKCSSDASISKNFLSWACPWLHWKIQHRIFKAQSCDFAKEEKEYIQPWTVLHSRGPGVACWTAMASCNECCIAVPHNPVDLLLKLAHAEFETEEHHHPCLKPHQKSLMASTLNLQKIWSSPKLHEGPLRSYASSMKIHKKYQKIAK